MHVVSVHPVPEMPRDCWSITADELERLAVALMGQRNGGWVRQNNAVKIAERHQPPDAKGLLPAITDLGTRAQKILSLGSRGATLRAAAYWHLRFQNLHPLRDGNGRIGRLLLAVQCERASKFQRMDILASLYELQNEYKWVFVPDEQAQRFELLLDILGRITATPLPEEAFQLPLTLEPLEDLKMANRTAYTGPRSPARSKRSFWRHLD